MRKGVDDNELKNALMESFRQRPKDGFEAEALRKNNIPVSESMSTIGG
jgi:cyclic pyranopterin phosphate synthase